MLAQPAILRTGSLERPPELFATSPWRPCGGHRPRILMIAASSPGCDETPSPFTTS